MVYGRRKRERLGIGGRMMVEESDCVDLTRHGRERMALKDLPLIDAAYGKDLKGIKEALGLGADINAREGDRLGHPAITICMDNPEILKFLIDNGADVDRTDNLGWSPLAWAIVSDNIKAAGILIENGADVNGEAGGVSLLAWAMIYRKKEMVDLLKKHGAVCRPGELKEE